MELMNIDQIIIDNEYLRLDSDVEQLKKSIETVGLINPLILNEDHKLIAGGRRYTALKQLGHETVPVFIINKTELEQELVSIDENLIRLDLNKVELEKSLSRGREIYEKLYPEALKFENEDLSTPEAQEIKFDLPNEQRSYIDLTAEKTGLSKKVIKSAIEREERASDAVKSLRSHGELNASQTNEIIKLEKDDQEKIAELIPGKSAKEIRDIVKKVNQKGVEQAIEEVTNEVGLPKEYKSLQTLVTRTNKTLGKILFEEITLSEENEPDRSKILEAISTMRISLDQLLTLFADGPSKPQIQDEEEDDLAMPAAEMINSEENEYHPEV